jgi:hypothetical protein
MRVGDEIKNL